MPSRDVAQLARGRQVFAQACAACHTLTGQNSDTRGGDLAIANLSADEIASFVRVMPVRISDSDTAAVAAYVRDQIVRCQRSAC